MTRLLALTLLPLACGCTTAQLSSPATRLAIDWIITRAVPQQSQCVGSFAALPSLSAQIVAALAERRARGK